LAREPQAEWRTEREVGRVLRGSDQATRGRGQPRKGSHRPDGLLLLGSSCIAVELEHTDKGDLRYADICRWFAMTIRVDSVRWYADNPKIMSRIRRVSVEHGFAQDIDFSIEPFPQGVALRDWVKPSAPDLHLAARRVDDSRVPPPRAAL